MNLLRAILGHPKCWICGRRDNINHLVRLPSDWQPWRDREIDRLKSQVDGIVRIPLTDRIPHHACVSCFSADLMNEDPH